ncbi:hypothetical protein XELAEV_18007299mg [Xenopus laevis]|uniref:Ig-like domain-containing protein n=1 Tax=Xenopus laevis TaxID=8355 RepID=A0A974I527_XENLA|nr:hypothetical protein XELAEV_18007299mg [Xenopus laevis]
MSDVQMVQQNSETAKYGGNIKLWCAASGYIFPTNFLAWLKHVPGKDILYIGNIFPQSGGISYSSLFKGGKFTITTDNAKSTGYLQIDKVDLEDAAVYYCARQAHYEY